MAEFASPFPGVVPDRKLTLRELTRGLRMMVAAEHEAVHLYEALADATDHPLAKEVLQDIANEERVHAGEFQRLLGILLPDEDGFLAKGAAEVNELAEKTGGSGESAEGAPAPKALGDLKGSAQ